MLCFHGQFQLKAQKQQLPAYLENSQNFDTTFILPEPFLMTETD